MIDEIFEMIMKEARKRPGDNLQIKAFLLLLELLDRVMASCNFDRVKAVEAFSKEYKNP